MLMMLGPMLLDLAHKFWSGQETMTGDVLKLGFLFLYSLFTGKCPADNLQVAGC